MYELAQCIRCRIQILPSHTACLLENLDSSRHLSPTISSQWRFTDKRLSNTRAIAHTYILVNILDISKTLHSPMSKLIVFLTVRPSVSYRAFNRSLFPAHLLPRQSFLRTRGRIHTFGDDEDARERHVTHDMHQTRSRLSKREREREKQKRCSRWSIDHRSSTTLLRARCHTHTHARGIRVQRIARDPRALPRRARASTTGRALPIASLRPAAWTRKPKTAEEGEV